MGDADPSGLEFTGSGVGEVSDTFSEGVGCVDASKNLPTGVADAKSWDSKASIKRKLSGRDPAVERRRVYCCIIMNDLIGEIAFHS